MPAPSDALVFGTGEGVGAYETGVFFNKFCKLPRLIVSGRTRFTVTVILVSVPFPFPLVQLLTPPVPRHRKPNRKPPLHFFVHLFPGFFDSQYGGEDGRVLHNSLGPF